MLQTVNRGDVRGSSAEGGLLEVDPKPSHTQVAVIAMVSFQRKPHVCKPKARNIAQRRNTIPKTITLLEVFTCRQTENKCTGTLQPTWPRNRSLGQSFQRVGKNEISADFAEQVQPCAPSSSEVRGCCRTWKLPKVTYKPLQMCLFVSSRALCKCASTFQLFLLC